MGIVPIMAVFLGGGTGALFRFWIAKMFPYTDGFPWATFLANLISCAILGFLMSYQSQKYLGQNAQLLLITGFCGGFSTFSTFSGESYYLLKQGQYLMWVIYVFSSILICLLSFHIGTLLVKS